MNRLAFFAVGCLLPLLSIGQEIVVSTAPERHAPAVSRCECLRDMTSCGPISPCLFGRPWFDA